MIRVDRRRFITVAGAVTGAAVGAAPLSAWGRLDEPFAGPALRTDTVRCAAVDWPVEPLSPGEDGPWDERASRLAADVAALGSELDAIDLLLLTVLPGFTRPGAEPWLRPLRAVAQRGQIGVLLADSEGFGAVLIEPDGNIRPLPRVSRTPTPRDVCATSFGNWLYADNAPQPAHQQALSAAGVECVLLPPLAALPLEVHAPLALLTAGRGRPPLPPGCPDLWTDQTRLTYGLPTLTSRLAPTDRALVPIAALRRARLAR